MQAVKCWLRRSSTSRNALCSHGGMADDAMFEYTSGRWIFNESLRKKERRLQFDIPSLRHAIAAPGSSTGVASLEKVAEGGFNRIFQATLTDGRQVLARLPYPSTIPAHYTVASEVATMEYLRLNGIPVPKVYGWSSTVSNPVGAEYIILEKLEGTTLGEVWFSLGFDDRYKVIEQLVKLERKLFSLELPASGSIYLPNDLSEDERERSVRFRTHGVEFCMGPMAHYSWWHKGRDLLDCDRGPWSDSTLLLAAVGEREAKWMNRFAKPRLHFERLYREVHKYQKMSPVPHINSLNEYLKLTHCLGYPAENRLSRPILRHPDLQPNNIILSPSLDIVGLIDWQHATCLPLFLAAGIPNNFQNYGDPESERMVQPDRELPPDFKTMSAEQQASVKELYLKRLNHFLYAALTLRHNEEHYEAIFSDGVIIHQRLYTHAGRPWEGDSITLQAELIHAIEHWQDVISSGATKCEKPPIKIPEESARSIMAVFNQQQEMDTMMDEMRKALGVDVYGWVSNEDFASTKEMARNIKAQMIEAADPAEKDGIRHHFPFDDFDEDG